MPSSWAATRQAPPCEGAQAHGEAAGGEHPGEANGALGDRSAREPGRRRASPGRGPDRCHAPVTRVEAGRLGRHPVARDRPGRRCERHRQASILEVVHRPPRGSSTPGTSPGTAGERERPRPAARSGSGSVAAGHDQVRGSRGDRFVAGRQPSRRTRPDRRSAATCRPRRRPRRSPAAISAMSWRSVTRTPSQGRVAAIASSTGNAGLERRPGRVFSQRHRRTRPGRGGPGRPARGRPRRWPGGRRSAG